MAPLERKSSTFWYNIISGLPIAVVNAICLVPSHLLQWVTYIEYEASDTYLGILSLPSQNSRTNLRVAHCKILKFPVQMMLFSACRQIVWRPKLGEEFRGLIHAL
jgi:hypothetical protein